MKKNNTEYVDLKTAKLLKELDFNTKTVGAYLLESYQYHKKNTLVFKNDTIAPPFVETQFYFDYEEDTIIKFVYAPTWWSVKHWLYKKGFKFNETHPLFSSSLEHEIKIDGYDNENYFFLAILKEHDIYKLEIKAIKECINYLYDKKRNKK